MPSRVTKEQLARRDILAANLRVRATALNATIAAFNREVAPLARAVVEAQFDYNETMEQTRTLANQISEAAQEQLDAKSERWQDSDNGIQVRTWIEQWDMSLDDVGSRTPRTA